MTGKKLKITFVLSALLLAACDTTMTASSFVDMLDPLDFFSSPVNMMQKNYATADYLTDRAKGYMKPGAKIKAMPLLDTEDPRLITRFSKQIPEQIGERFTQLGYNVDVSVVSTDANPAFAAAPQPVTNHPDFILSGSYTRKSSDVDVRIYIQDARTGMERGSLAYTLKRSGDIRKDSKPQPVIYRTQD